MAMSPSTIILYDHTLSRLLACILRIARPRLHSFAMFLKSRDTTSSAGPTGDSGLATDALDVDDTAVVPIPSLTSVNQSSLPWVEKYRPKKLDDVSHQPQAVNALKTAIVRANLPHLLLYGPAGTGKTSTVLALARELYGPELAAKRVMELNASDERGIEVIRVKVKEFAALAVSAKSAHSPYPQPSYKLIILDECDSLTKDAQSALRRTMEQYTKVTRFCLICNYVSRLIEPLQSRCTKFRFTPISASAMAERLSFIATSENLAFEGSRPEVLDAIVERSGGDLRQAITMMQSVARQTENRLSLNAIRATTTDIPLSLIDELEAAVRARGFDAIRSCVANMRCEGHDTVAAFHQWLQRLRTSSDWSDEFRAALLLAMAKCEARLLDGADEAIQLTSVLAEANRRNKACNV